jgi:membrane protease YdiL (CAAX protease family)
MTLALGNPNLPGNQEYVRKTGWLLLLWLLPYFALGIGDGIFLPELVLSPVHFWIYDFAKFVLLPAVYLLFFYRYLHIHPGSYFFTSHRIAYNGWEWTGVTLFSALVLDVIYNSANLLVTLALGAVVIPLGWLLSPWFELPAISLDYPPYFAYQMALPDDRILHALVAIFFSITAGVVEEIFFRGLLRQAIAAILSPQAVKTYIALSALIFGLAHWEQGSYGLIGATLFGACAAWLYLKLGDLRPLIFAHALIDLYIYW